MGKTKRNGNGNQNQQVNQQKQQEKSGLIKRIKTWPERHPRITKGVRIGVTIVGGTLAAVGGAGLGMAIKERYGTKPETPGLPETPQLTMPDPGPVYPEE
jgi:hypothetical protein